MRRLVIGSCIVGVALVVAAPAARANPDAADLAVSVTWAGSGAPKARVGEPAPVAVTVTDLGPDAAQQVDVLLGMSDQFNPLSSDCGAGTPQPSNAMCSFASLAPGASVTVEFTAVVCCFPKGESRNAFLDAGVRSLTPDPNADNDFQTFDVRVIGGPGFFPPSG